MIKKVCLLLIAPLGLLDGKNTHDDWQFMGETAKKNP
jgi:hypothetical protein